MKAINALSLFVTWDVLDSLLKSKFCDLQLTGAKQQIQPLDRRDQFPFCLRGGGGMHAA